MSAVYLTKFSQDAVINDSQRLCRMLVITPQKRI